MSRQGTPAFRSPAGLILLAMLAGLLLMPLTASAAEQVGRVLAASGDVTAERDGTSMRGLGRQDPIYEGDRIRTGTRGRVQVRFQDGAMVDLDPASAFEVEEYASADEDGDDGGSAVMSFLQGAMRTITGAIGTGSDDTYRMSTTVATIGVRGTAYALEYCDDACVEEGGQPGLYGRVDDGEVEVDAPGGTGAFGNGQYFFVPEGGAPERIVAPPDGVLEGDGETGAGGDDDRIEDVSIKPLDTGDEDGLGLGGNDTDLLDPDFEQGENEDIAPEAIPRPGTTEEIFFAGGFVAGQDGGLRESAFVLSPGEGDVRLDGGDLVGVEFPSSGFVDPSEGTLNTGSTTVGFAPDEVDVQWGWWDGPLRFESRAGQDDGGAFVYGYTDPTNITPTSTLNNLADFASFSPYGNSDGTTTFPGVAFGGPGGFDAAGGSWTVNELGLNVDFVAGQPELLAFELTDFSTTIDMTNGNTLGTLDLGESTLEITGLEDSDGGYEGELRGVFLGPNADGLLLRFDLTGDNEITGVIVTEEVPN